MQVIVYKEEYSRKRSVSQAALSAIEIVTCEFLPSGVLRLIYFNDIFISTINGI
jgi:hypothetical protein